MDVRIGIVQSMKELDIELPDDADRDKVLADIEAALAEEGRILWLTDRKGRQVGVPVGKVAYVEVDPPAVRPSGRVRDLLIRRRARPTSRRPDPRAAVRPGRA